MEKYSKAEQLAIQEKYGPAADVAAKSILKQTGHKINSDPGDHGSETLDLISMANERSKARTRVKEARQLGYTVVGISAAGIIN